MHYTLPVTLTARELLSDSGPIATRVRERFGAFESRPEQLAMVAAVARSLEQRGTLVVEAGTGVGKSFAYLVPAIVRAVTTGQKVVVATATIALQEQLVQKDIPMLRAALGLNDDAAPGSSVLGAEARFPLVPVLAKGRGNYVSIRRLKLASQRQDALLHDEQQRRSLHVIEDWAYTTGDGSLASLPALERPEVWDHARSDADNCMGRKCPHFKECFFQSARRELERANLIVCNHALFFSDLALRSRGVVGASVLPAYDHVILDEAHNVEDAACEHFGLSLAEPRVMRLLRTLFSPKRRKGYLLDRGLSLGEVGAVDRALTLVQEAEHASHELFAGLYDFHQRHRSSSGRLRAPGSELGIDNPLSPAMSQLAICLRRIRDAIESEQDRFELSSFARRAADIADTAEAMVEQTLSGYVYWIDVEREAVGGGVGGDDHESSPRPGAGPSRFGPRVSLNCAPVDVAPLLKRFLFEPEEAVAVRTTEEDTHAEAGDAGDAFEADVQRALAEAQADIEQEEVKPGVRGDGVHEPKRSNAHSDSSAALSTRGSVILTSATLATRTIREDEHPERAETAFAHLMTRLGVSTCETVQLGSPFDYSRQAKIIIDTSVPNPRGGGASTSSGSSSEGADYLRVLSNRIEHHVRATRGGAFVLFTSFATLYAVADLLKPRLARHDLTLLAQGRDGPRSMMLQRFLEIEDAGGGGGGGGGVGAAKGVGGAVLFGAASFWQGVDVRGERLRNVIITRLPFEPPDRPLTQARGERLESTGANPFMHDALPRAIIRFKQGFGRLIRSATDTGQVVVLDSRIKTARYGKLFLDALPTDIRVEQHSHDWD